MKKNNTFAERFRLQFNQPGNQRIIAGKEVVLHCHHYNARLQNALESVSQINGKKIISSSAEAVFAEQISNAFTAHDTIADKWQIALQLYAHLGYGLLDISEINAGVIYGISSHYAEGWRICFRYANRPICTFTEGYIQAMYYAITGTLVYAKEVECMHQGAPRCRFEINPARSESFTEIKKQSFEFTPIQKTQPLHSTSVDEQQIINALVDLPIHGNNEGLIPQFNVYLASTPADYYNLVSIRFLEAMNGINRLSSGQRLLLFCAEICGLTTFRGIMSSPEWQSLIEPMINQDTDRLLAIFAISNGLGWGNWHVLAHEPEVSLQLQSIQGYEAMGYRQYRAVSHTPQCIMFTGVAAGIMELLYGEGNVEDRYGTFASSERQCICCADDSCQFEVKVL